MGATESLSLNYNHDSVGAFTAHSPKAASPELSRQPIETYYSIENELEFIKNKGEFEGEEEKAFYLRENVRRFLQEFVGHIAYTEIRYLIRNGRLYYPGIGRPVGDAYQETAYLQGAGSREWSEHVGFTAVESAIVSGGACSSLLISPPSSDQLDGGMQRVFGDYGFVFAFSKNGDVVSDYVVRYPESRLTIENSNRIYHNAVSMSKYHSDERFFLENPIVLKTGADVREQCRRLGLLTDADIARSAQFDTVLHELAPLIDEYVLLLTGMQDVDRFQSPYFAVMLTHAKTMLKAIYNRAEALKKEYEFSGTIAVQYANLMDYEKQALIQQYGKRDAFVVGGGSCPSVSATASSDILLLTSGRATFQEAQEMAKRGFDCPECGGHIAWGSGNTCPHCHITKEQYASKTGRQACE